MEREPPVSSCSKILTTSGNQVDECNFPGLHEYEIKLKERQISWQLHLYYWPIKHRRRAATPAGKSCWFCSSGSREEGERPHGASLVPSSLLLLIFGYCTDKLHQQLVMPRYMAGLCHCG
jgi:hypothetical protein